MGNCIIFQKKVIKVIKTDGEIRECKPPMKVHHLMSKFGGHANCDRLPVVQHLHPDANMIGGHQYYILPRFAGPSEDVKKTGKTSSTVTDMGQGSGSGVLRIKLVMSKQELQAMLQKGGITVDNMVSNLQTSGKLEDTECRKRSAGWTPMLESIPEGN